MAFDNLHNGTVVAFYLSISIVFVWLALIGLISLCIFRLWIWWLDYIRPRRNKPRRSTYMSKYERRQLTAHRGQEKPDHSHLTSIDNNLYNKIDTKGVNSMMPNWHASRVRRPVRNSVSSLSASVSSNNSDIKSLGSYIERDFTDTRSTRNTTRQDTMDGDERVRNRGGEPDCLDNVHEGITSQQRTTGCEDRRRSISQDRSLDYDAADMSKATMNAYITNDWDRRDVREGLGSLYGAYDDLDNLLPPNTSSGNYLTLAQQNGVDLEDSSHNNFSKNGDHTLTDIDAETTRSVRGRLDTNITDNYGRSAKTFRDIARRNS